MTHAAMSPTIGVVYLARSADGLPDFRRFADSYRRHPAGINHELIVVYKGFSQQSELQEARAVFQGIPHVGIELDDVGFDIGTYLETSQRVSHDYLCFLNTHTEIAAPGWLGQLFRYASRSGVGIAGAAGSYESLRQSWELIQMFYWLYYMERFPYDETVAKYYTKFTEYLPLAPSNPVQSTVAKSGMKGLIAETALAVRYRLALRRFQPHWHALLRPGKMFAALAPIPAFPNPHIRSNGFMLRRDHLKSFQNVRIATKDDACFFESGPESVTARLRNEGLSAIVVGRDGHGYDVADWWRSRTFRLGDQGNLLLTDNHSRAFVTMSTEDRATHVRMTWGEYLGPPPADCPILGIRFRKRSLALPSRDR